MSRATTFGILNVAISFLGLWVTDTISGSFLHSLTLAAPDYASPALFSGVVDATGGDAAIYLPSAWSLDITGTVFGRALGLFADAAVSLTNAQYVRGRNGAGIDLAGGGSFYNANGASVIGGAQGVAGADSAATTVTNAGTLLGATAGLETGPGLVTNDAQGVIAGEGIGVALSGAATLANNGLVEALAAGGVGVSLAGAAALRNQGAVTGYTGIVAAGGTVFNQGFIAGETLNAGALLASDTGYALRFTAPGTFIEDAGLVSGSVVGDGGLLVLEAGALSEVSGFAVDSFASGAAETLATSLAGLGTLAGFIGEDLLHVTDLGANSAYFFNHVLTLQNAGTLAGLITFSANYPQIFKVAADPAGGVDITAPCFCAGTRIATPQGELPIETLAIGDLVRTRDAGDRPIRWIGRRRYSGREVAGNLDLRPVRIAAGVIAPGIPARPLRLSPGHALCIGEALVPAGALVNGTTITRDRPEQEIRYFHLDLAEHQIIFAEGCAAETFLEDALRWQFENAAEFAALHTAPAPRRPCLPRLVQGFALDAIQRRLGRDPPPGSGPLRGFVEQAGQGCIAGWAQYVLEPDAPVCLDVFGGGRRRARVLANRYRADLRRAGIGDGSHAFDVRLAEEPDETLEIRCAASGEILPFAEPDQKVHGQAA